MPLKALWGIIGAGLALMYFFGRNKVTVEIKPTEPEKPVNRDELSRVMSHLGKRSGKARAK